MNEKKITIYDIAAETGVSVGTVNRALNNKPRISPETKALVLETAARLGYKVNPAAQGLRRNHITIGAILFCPIEEYVSPIIQGINSAALDLEKYNVTVDVHYITEQKDQSCLQQTEALLQQFAENNYNGVVLFLSALVEEMEGVRNLIHTLNEQGMVFATVASDIPDSDRVLHVGCDAFTAGKMAAELLDISCHGKDVAVLVASTDSPVNRDYIRGFRCYAGEDTFSDIRIYQHLDQADKICEVTEQMLQQMPALCGVYMATASSAIACDYIHRRDIRGLSVITTDLLRRTTDLLAQKIATAAIFQNPYRQGRNAVKLLYQQLTGNDVHGVHLIPPQILLSSNLDAYLGNSENY